MPAFSVSEGLKMIIAKRFSALALALTMAVSADAFAWGTDDLEAQLNAQQSTMLNMQNAFDQLQSQIDAQNGQIEELKHEIEMLQQEVNALKQNAAAAGNSENSQGSTAADSAKSTGAQANAGAGMAVSTQKANGAVTDAKGKALKASDDGAKKAYNEAYQMVVNNKLSQSVPAFKSYLEKYPDNDLTPNAWYWLGQVQFKQKQYEDARVSFLNAAGFKNSAKRPDSLYKLGLIYKQNGDKDKARRFFEVVVKSYPSDTSAALAQKQLSSL